MNKVKFPTTIAIACGLLLLVAGVSNGIMDTLQFHYGKSLFPKVEGETLLGQDREFWDPEISWKNKYRDYDAGDKRPAFWLSTTALVFLTDAWHLFQFIMLSAFQLAIIIPFLYFLRIKWYWALPALIPAKALFGIAFTLMYSYVLVKLGAS